MSKFWFNTLFFAGILVFLSPGLYAQEGVRYENPQWKRVVLLDFHNGKEGRAMEIVENYFMKASEKAGTPNPEMMIDLKTGEWDRMIVWNMDGGIESMNWQVTPNNQKWWAALTEIAGSGEKATEIMNEYQSLVARSNSNVGLSE